MLEAHCKYMLITLDLLMAATFQMEAFLKANNSHLPHLCLHCSETNIYHTSSCRIPVGTENKDHKIYQPLLAEFPVEGEILA